MHNLKSIYSSSWQEIGWEANTLLDIFQTGMNPLKQLQIFCMSLLAHYQKQCDDICVDNGKAI